MFTSLMLVFELLPYMYNYVTAIVVFNCNDENNYRIYQISNGY